MPHTKWRRLGQGTDSAPSPSSCSALTGGHGDGPGAVPSVLLLQVLRQAQLRGERGPGTPGEGGWGGHAPHRPLASSLADLLLSYVTLVLSGLKVVCLTETGLLFRLLLWLASISRPKSKRRLVG